MASRRCDEIMRHAIAHFAANGYPNADLDALAADIGCAKGTLYRYYKSKRDLFAAAVDLIIRDLIDYTEPVNIEDPIEQMRFSIKAFLCYFAKNPNYIELLIQERAEFRDREEPTYAKYRKSVHDRWRPHVKRLIEAGVLRSVPAERVLDVTGDTLYGTIFVNYFAGRRKTLEQQAADVLDVLMKGLLADGGDKRS